MTLLEKLYFDTFKRCVQAALATFINIKPPLQGHFKDTLWYCGKIGWAVAAAAWSQVFNFDPAPCMDMNY